MLSCLAWGESQATEPILKVHLSRSSIIQALVRPAIVVEIKVPAQTFNCLPAIPVLIEVNFLVLDRPPEPLREYIVKDPAPTIHTYSYLCLLQNKGKIPAGKLAALVSVENFRSGNPQGSLQRLYTK